MSDCMRTSRLGRMTTVLVLLILLALSAGVVALAGCGESGGDTTTTGPAEETIVHPSGASEIVLRVSTGGGLVPLSYLVTHIPQFNLYGDGTVIVTGPVPAIYPGPALPNLQTTKIPEEAVQEVLSAARQAGLFDSGIDYGLPGIADGSTTTMTVNAEGTTYISEIYALGMESGAGSLTTEQQQARAVVGELVGKLADLTSFDTGELQWSPYDYTTLAVYSRAIDPGESPGGGDVEPNRLQWSLGDLSTVGEVLEPQGFRRFFVSCDLLAELQPLLREATQITVWTVGDREYSLLFRPLLPDEEP